MSESAAAEKIELSREEYEKLLASAPKQTITVDAAEYNQLVAGKGALEKVTAERDRYAGRMRELELCLRREQQEHGEEVKGLLTELRKYRPVQQ